QRRNNTKGTSIVTSTRDRDPSGITRLTLCWQRGGACFQSLQELSLSLVARERAVEQDGERANVMRAMDDVYPGGPFRDRAPVAVLVSLRQTAPNGNWHAGMFIFRRFEVPKVTV